MNDPEARIVIVAPTYNETVKTNLEGPSGILTLCPPWFQPKYEKARRKLTWENGAQCTWLPASAPNKFRGHAASFIAVDEIVAFEPETGCQTLDECYRIARVQTQRMKKLGLSPRVVITTTPESSPIFRHLLSNYRDNMVVSRSGTADNRANLDPNYVKYALRLAHTAVGKREFLGELSFDDLDSAMFRNVDWNKSRLTRETAPTIYDQIFISLDPATGEGVRRDTTAIIVVGTKVIDGLTHAYILQDKSVNTPSPTEWAKRVSECYHAWEPYVPNPRNIWVSAETNAAGALVKTVLKQVDPALRIRTYRAHESKAIRAAPTSGLAEAGLVHLVGRFPDLERELSYFTGAENEKNDRADAMASACYFWIVLRQRNYNIHANATPDSDSDDE
jgi:phage terminase large subunit-like protein